MNKNKKQIFALVAGAMILVVAVVGLFIFAYGKKDEKGEALKEIERFFTVTKDSCLSRYLEYDKFEDLFYENDVSVSGELYEEIAGVTIEAAIEGGIDKSERLVKAGVQVGLGGMPFVEFEGYSDDTNLYGATELVEDKLMFLNYKGDLSELGSRLGMNASSVNIFQKSYIEFFQCLVSNQKNSRMQQLLKNQQIRKDLQQLYNHMKVEKEESSNNGEGEVVYGLTIPAEEMQTLVTDLETQFREFQSQGYSEIVDKFISQQGILLWIVIPEQGNPCKIFLENPDNGYVMTFTKEEQEKEGETGFDEILTAVLEKGEKTIFNGTLTLDYTVQGNKIAINFNETENRIQASISGTLTPDKKKQKISLYMEEMELVYHNTTMDLRGNLQVSYGEFSVALPELEMVDILHGSEQERKEFKSQLAQGLKGIVGSGIRRLLKHMGISL